LLSDIERSVAMATVLIERVRHLKGEEKPPAFAEVEKTIDSAKSLQPVQATRWTSRF